MLMWHDLDKLIASDPEGKTLATKYLDNTGVGWGLRNEIEGFLGFPSF
jgi:hypothetical protein